MMKESSSSRTRPPPPPPPPPPPTTTTTTKTPMVDVDDGGSKLLATSCNIGDGQSTQHANNTQNNNKGGGGGGGNISMMMMIMMNNKKNRQYTLRIFALLACCAFEMRQIAITRTTVGSLLPDHRQPSAPVLSQQRVQAKRPYNDNTGNVTTLSPSSVQQHVQAAVLLSAAAAAAAVSPDFVKTMSNFTRKSSPNNNTISTAFLWQASTTIPRWMKDYFAWHHDQVVNHMNQENWQSYQFLVMRCLEHETCGGASDRLQSIPKQIRLASMSKRLLFIQWTKPAALQEFLVPPMRGMNWTIPSWLDALLDYRSTIQKFDPLSKSDNKRRVVAVKDQSHDHGYHFYTQQARAATTENNTNYNIENEEEEEEEANFDKVFRDVWNVLFTPAPPVQALIDQNMKELSLVPGQYVAVHVRSKYKVDKSNNLPMIHNSINCASTMLQQNQPDDGSLWPIYFASDSSNAIKHAVQYVQQGKKNASRIEFRKTDREPLHLDRGGSDFLKKSNAWRNNTASDFYDVFVDLYLLANSGCSTIGIGGFGKWGALMSYNASCIVRHDRNKCPWTMTTTT